MLGSEKPNFGATEEAETWDNLAVPRMSLGDHVTVSPQTKGA